MTLAFDLPALNDSYFRRMDARWKLAALVPAAILIALLRTPALSLVALVGALALVNVAQLPWRWLLRRLTWTALLLAMFLIWLPFLPASRGETYDLAWLTISETGLERFGAVLFK